MIRVLLFLMLGGAVTLLLLSTTGSLRFVGWAIGFTIAAGVLLTIGIIQRVSGRSRRIRDEMAAATDAGRIRAALIISRRQTGLYVNEQPQIEFSLLVDRPSATPFLTATRSIVSLIDLASISPGAYLAVAHPDDDDGRVHIVDAPVPLPSQPLTHELAAAAETLPIGTVPRTRPRAWSILSAIAALVIGAVGAPFLAAPNAIDYLRLIAEGRTDQVDRVDHPVLFEPASLEESMVRVSEELGHDEVYTVGIRDVTMHLTVAAGATARDQVTVQDHRITDRRAHTSAAGPDEGSRFRLSEVAWTEVLAGLEEAKDVVASRGLVDPELERLHVERDSSAFGRIEVRAFFRNERGSESVSLDAAGELFPPECFALLTADEQAGYLYDPARFSTAVRDSLVAAAGDVDDAAIVSVVNYGDRLSVTTYEYEGPGRSHTVAVDHRYGFVRDLGRV